MHPHSRGAMAPEVLQTRPLKSSRAQGKPGAQRTHSLACEMKKAHEQVTTGPPKRSGLPCAMVYGLFCALPGVHDLLVTVARAVRKHCHELGTSLGVPEPHSFAVRIKRCSSVSAFASTASHPAFVT